MFMQQSTIEMTAGKATKVEFIYTAAELAMIKADQPDIDVKSSFSFIARNLTGCFMPLRGMAITLTKASQFVQAFIIQAEYEKFFGVSIQAEIDDAIHNPDRE